MAAGGDGRDSSVPLYTVPVRRTVAADGTITFEVNSSEAPSSVQIAGGTNAVTVIGVGASQYALMVRDSESRRLLEGIYLELKQLNQNLTR